MKNTHILFSVFAGIALFTSCSSDDNSSPEEGSESAEAKYIITATPTASEGVADYILTADDLTQGSISTVGNGLEQDGTYRYYVTSNNKFFSMLYGQGNPGAVTTYQLNDTGSLDKLSDFQSETVQAFAPVDNDILLMKISRSSDDPTAYWYSLDTQISQFVAEGQINTQELAAKENGEIAFFTWITQVGNKVYLPYYTIKGTGDDRNGTLYPDEANIAVFSYPEMAYEKTIHDDRTSFIGRYFTSGLAVDELGDTYALSSSIATFNGDFVSTKPSAITRIKSGATEFDTFYFNIEEATGGKYATTQMYLGNGKLLLNLEDVANRGAYTTGKEYAIVDLYSETLTMVTGTPNVEDIVVVTSRSTYISEDKTTAYVGITTNTGSFVYNIDVATATATQGLEVEGGVITAINRLNPAN
ncbi:DUF4374 domain-containing protein [Formosa sp. 4Alg 33]|uniref:DUF4374 domain-containing protein n=1 Tax=Formosa sp. 4Alg 33 TaxID=3382189 RepID=UPI003D9C6312